MDPVTGVGDSGPLDDRQAARQAAVQRAVAAALGRWPGPQATAARQGPEPRDDVPVFEPAARPLRGPADYPAYAEEARVAGGAEEVSRRESDEESFRAGIFSTLRRLAVWLLALLGLGLGLLWDFLLGRSSQQSRARRLRQVLQMMGPTFIKVGQQLSIRIDMIPKIYANELELLLDSAQPMHIADAVTAIEAAAGGPIGETYIAFDPKPIGSASLACVYRAELPNGDRVAIKVRRPKVGEIMAADLRALAWLFRVCELIWLPPGMTANFVYDLRNMLLSELDFRQEARLTDLFRRQARKDLKWASSPRVYFELSGREVLVAELVEGTQLSELLAASDRRDQAALERFRAQGIEPKKIAQRLIRLARYSGFEGIFFHADMHPANIFVKPKSKIVLIDFGSCGAFTKEDGTKWHELFRAQSRGDVGGMAKAAVALIEPLPPIDVEEFRRKVEELFWRELYAFRSKHSAWWERTTAHLWLGYLRLTREYDMAINLNTLRMIRVTLLVDTLAGRLYSKTDHYREYQKYARNAGRRAKKRLWKRFRNLFRYETFIRIEQALDTGTNLAYRLAHFAESLPYRFSMLISKAAYATMQITRALVVGSFVTGCAVLAMVGYRKFLVPGKPGEPLVPPTPEAAFKLLLHNGWYQSAVLIIVLLTLRRVLYRVEQRDVERQR